MSRLPQVLPQTASKAGTATTCQPDKSWISLGQTIDPAALDCPVLIALPARDRIVPPESARSLADLIPHATRIEPKAGHVGMVAGRRSLPTLWQPVLSWLTSLE